ncbi:MAG: YraN family protein [Eubacteriales bacterium]|nr:YraN family protein [Eubacteriales bacterium]
MNNVSVWKSGEKLAVKYLKKQGYNILETNAKNKIAEVDIICEKNDEIVFVEVKSRSNKNYGEAMEAVDIRKQRAYVTFSTAYVVAKLKADKNIRFDVIEVYGEDINHIESAFDGDVMKKYVKRR